MLGFFKKAIFGGDSKPKAEESPPSNPAAISPTAGAARSAVKTTAKSNMKRSRSQLDRDKKREAFSKFVEEIPHCAEKLLLELLYHFEYEKTKKSDQSLLENPKMVAKQVEEQLKAENLYADTDAKRILPELYKAIDENMSDECLTLIDEILLQIRPLEIDALLESVETSKKFAKIIKDKEIILLLGVSGAGKSTTIQFLAGSVMHEIEIDGLKHIEAAQYKNSAVETVKTSPFSQSETRSINAVEIKLSEIGLEGDDVVIVCDTPGFGDTEGPAMDISNGIGLSAAMKCCRSIRPVVVMSKVSMGDRMQGLGEMAKILTKLFGNIDEHLSAFTYIFTKFSKSEGSEIYSKLIHFKRSINKGGSEFKNNKALQNILQDMIDKTKAGALVVDPLNDEAKNVMQHLIDHSQPISDPQHVINEFITPEAMVVLQQQLVKLQNSVRGAIQREDLTLLKYRLQRLAKLAAALNLKECSDFYDAARLDVFDLIKQTMEDFEQVIGRVFQDSNITFEADKGDFPRIPVLLQRFEQLEAIRTENAIENTENLLLFSSLRLIEVVKGPQERFFQRFDRKAFAVSEAGSKRTTSTAGEAPDNDKEKEKSEPAMSQFDFTIAASTLMKLYHLKRMITTNAVVSTKDQVEQMYENCVATIRSQWKESCDEAKKSIQELDFFTFSANMNFIKLIEEAFTFFLSDRPTPPPASTTTNNTATTSNAPSASTGSVNQYSSLASEFSQHLEKLTKTAIASLEKSGELTGSGNGSGVAVVQLLSQLETSHYPREITSHLSKSPEVYYQSLRDHGISVVKTRITQVEGCITEDDPVQYEVIASCLQVVDSLRGAADIKMNTVEESTAAYERIRNKVAGDYLFLSNCLADILTRGGSVHWHEKKLRMFGGNVVAADKYLQSVSHLYSGELAKLQKQLEDGISDLTDRFGAAKVKLEDSTEFPYWVAAIYQVTALCDFLHSPSTKLMDAFVSLLQEELGKVYQSIQQCIGADIAVDLNSFYNNCVYLTVFSEYGEQYPSLQSKTQLIQQTLSASMKKYELACLDYLQGTEVDYSAESYNRIAKCLGVLQSAVEFYQSHPLPASDKTSTSSATTSNNNPSTVGSATAAPKTKSSAAGKHNHNHNHNHSQSHSHSQTATTTTDTRQYYRTLLEDIPQRIIRKYCEGDHCILSEMHASLMAERQRVDLSGNIEDLYKFSKKIFPAPCLDRFLPKSCSPLYTVLCDLISQRLSESVSNMKTKIETLLESDKFKEAESLLTSFQASSLEDRTAYDDTITAASEILVKKFGDLADRMKRIENGLAPSELRDIALNITALATAQQYLRPFFGSSPALLHAFDDFLTYGDSLFGLMKAMLDQAKEAIDLNDFARAEKAISKCQDLANSLAGVKYQGESLKTVISDQLQEQRNGIAAIFKSRLEDIQALQWLPGYFEDIGRFLDVARQAAAVVQNTSRYEDVIQDVVRVVVDEISRQLLEAKQDPSPEALDILLEGIKECQPYFPAAVADKANPLIAEASEHLKKQHENISGSIQQEVVSDTRKFIDFFISLLRDRKFFKAKEYKENLVSYFEELRSKIRKSEKHGNLLAYFKEMASFADDGQYYLDKLTEIAAELNVKKIVAAYQQKLADQQAVAAAARQSHWSKPTYSSSGYNPYSSAGSHSYYSNSINSAYPNYNQYNRQQQPQYPPYNQPYNQYQQPAMSAQQFYNTPQFSTGYNPSGPAGGNMPRGGGGSGASIGLGNGISGGSGVPGKDYDGGSKETVGGKGGGLISGLKNMATGMFGGKTEKTPATQPAYSTNNTSAGVVPAHSSTTVTTMKLTETEMSIVKYQSLFTNREVEKSMAEVLDRAVRVVQNSLANLLSMNCEKPEALEMIAPHFESLVAVADTSITCFPFHAALDKVGIKGIEALALLKKCFQYYNIKLSASLQHGNFQLLAKLMDVVQRQEGVVTKAKTWTHFSTQTLANPKYKEYKEEVDKTKRYVELKRMVGEKIIEWKAVNMTSLKDNAQTTSVNAYDRDVFYKNLSLSFQRLKQLKPMAMHIDQTTADVNVVEKDCRLHISQEMLAIQEALTVLLPKIPNENEEIYTRFAALYDNFRAISVHFDDQIISQAAKEKANVIVSEFKMRLHAIRKDWESKFFKADGVDYLISQLIALKPVTIHIPALKNLIDETIDKFLFDVKRDEPQLIGKLGAKLNNHENKSITQMIINETKALNGYSLLLRNEKVLKFTHEHVLEKLEISSFESASAVKEGLKLQFEAYDKEYWAIVESGLVNLDVIDGLPSLAKKISQHSSLGLEEKTRHLIAHVAAFWTLDNYKAAGNAGNTDGSDPSTGSVKTNKDELLRPHAAQIISIFRLLNIQSKTVGKVKFSELLAVEGESKDSGEGKSGGQPLSRQYSQMPPAMERAIKALPKHLVQIFTGEGKSVTLAITAVTLALLGCVVDCACYSEYLSKRDFDAFSKLFTAFEVKKYIFYGTFHRLCENFINQDGDIRQFVEADVTGKKRPDSMTSRLRKGRPKILLIDEVDVFFSKDFYGNLYKPLATIKDTTIEELLKYVWQNRRNSSAIQFHTLKTHTTVQNCLKRFPQHAALIEECIKTLLSDLKDFESQDYVVDNDRIGYKDQDSVSYDIYYGYKTIFAYFKESEANPPRITKETLKSKLQFAIDCGSYSYAEIPKQYDCVMGVTGTLKTLSNPERKLLTDVYKIQTFSYIPSVYSLSNNKLGFAGDSVDDCRIEKLTGIHNVIRNEINKRLQPAGINVGNNRAAKRAVLVFFESVPKLVAFYNSSALADIRSNVILLTETTPTLQKEGIIRRAVMPGSITLLTRVFGRGTDFICYDENLLNSGGVHVIQTFVSDELSEEAQIQGRTARQGNSGSYSMVLVDKDLEKYGIDDAVLESMRNQKLLYKTINQKRCKFFEDRYPENMKYVDEIKRDHLKSMDFVAALLRNDSSKTTPFLIAQNKGPVIQAGVARTICLMDATGSMSNLLTKAKNTVKTMFERIQVVFDQKNITTVFYLQFVVYRNYSSPPDLLLQFSSWESQPNALRLFMDNIGVNGGLGNEAVEVGLAHVLTEHAKEKVDQVLLIGDMPPNTRQEVISHRGSYNGGEAGWQKIDRFKTPVFTDELLPKLKAAGVPVQGFYVAEKAKTAFEEISRSTGGKAEWLDINSDAGAESLIHSVCECTLLKAGGATQGKELVDAYRAQFRRGFVAA